MTEVVCAHRWIEFNQSRICKWCNTVWFFEEDVSEPRTVLARLEEIPAA